jgi:hypothetical protein
LGEIIIIYKFSFVLTLDYSSLESRVWIEVKPSFGSMGDEGLGETLKIDMLIE